MPEQTIRKTIVVLPAFNEEKNLPHLFGRIRIVMDGACQPYEVIVVDDGSTDATAEVTRIWAGQMPVALLQHESNQGLGVTLRDGLDAATRQSGPRDVIVTMDADDSHDPAVIPSMLKLVDDGADLVIGSRFSPGAIVRGVPWHRQFMSLAASWLFRALFPVRGVRDYTSGFRAYSAPSLADATRKYNGRLVDQAGFQCMADMLLKLRRLPLRFCEVPMTLRYDRKQGASKMKVARTAARTLALILQRRLGH
ncbi:MAG: glycosyltransferase family 2 protein [Acidobacteria bacterium]|nr:glycosyltransferase family 2 protein [Acidobacteriota bacterium]